MRADNIILITLLSVMLASAHVIKYEHNLEFVKYEVDEANSKEEDHLSVKIYTIGAMESKFNKLVNELMKQQQELFEKSKISSEKSLKKFNEDNQKISENSMEVIKWIKESLNEFENTKNEMEAKKLNISKNYMTEYLTLKNELDVKTLLCKNSIELLKNEKNFLIKLLNECSNCKTERTDLKREIQAADKSLRMENEYCDESFQSLHETMNNLTSNMKNDLINLLTTKNGEYLKIIENFYNVSKLEKLANDSVQSRTQYLSEKEQNESSLSTSLLNLNNMLDFDRIKPKNGEEICNTNKKELEGEDFIQNFLAETNGKENKQKSFIIQKLYVEEPSYLKWESIHEKTLFIPDNSVIAGKDIDGAILYVIRAYKDNEYTYGKYARLGSRRNAYIPYHNAEKGVPEIEVNLIKLSFRFQK